LERHSERYDTWEFDLLLYGGLLLFCYCFAAFDCLLPAVVCSLVCLREFCSIYCCILFVAIVVLLICNCFDALVRSVSYSSVSLAANPRQSEFVVAYWFKRVLIEELVNRKNYSMLVEQCSTGAREESEKFSDMNIDPFKGVGNGGVASSSGSSSLGPYLANGGNVDKSYHSLSNDFSFHQGISSLHLPR
ncbi:hypothetical protein LOK49_LG09G01034, partial [Camellia lanceoleosa]